MQNQRLPKIDMAKSGHKRSRFNFSHDVNTTADFGVCQPAMCKMIVPGSKTTLNTESLTRLAPMVAPTFGRLKYKIWHQFVEIDDICEQFNAFMAQEPIYSAVDAVTAVPTQVPSVPLSCLTSLCFVGARATIYKVTAGSGVWDYQYEAFRSNVSADMTEIDLLFNYKENSSSIFMACPIGYDTADNFSSLSSRHFVLNLASWQSGSTSGRRGLSPNWSTCNSPTIPFFSAPLQNVLASSSPYNVDLGWNINSNGDMINNPVMPESADFLYEFECYDGSNTKTYVIAFKFSDVGKRMRKNIIGLGYQLDLESQSEVSFLPLLAYYKAYWNLFGLTQWQDWQQTNCYKLIHLLNSSYNIHLGSVTDSTLSSNASAHFFTIFVDFIKDLMDVFVTDSADYVSSHLPTTSVSPVVPEGFISVANTTITSYDSSGSVAGIPSHGQGAPGNGHSYINNILHGHADEEFLKRLYKWTNRNTIIGRRIAELLRAQGLGKFVDECKSDFIGYTEDVITISDVVSTADTAFQVGSGATLGEFGGKGVQYTKGKNFIFENDVFGYWVTICAIVPESGFSQQIDPTLYALDKNGFYQPEFDSQGYDASRKCVVQGASDFRHKLPLDSLGATFGYKPRFFEYKFAQNITNGDMSLRGTRDTYLPYFLDKFIVVNDKYISAKSSNPAQFNVRNLFDASQLPTADERIWRFITKFPWLGNLRRIFAAGGNVDDNMRHRMTDLDFMYWVSSNHDDFLIHNIFDMQCYALPTLISARSSSSVVS